MRSLAIDDGDNYDLQSEEDKMSRFQCFPRVPSIKSELGGGGGGNSSAGWCPKSKEMSCLVCESW
jgi:hypothetical protein